MEIESVPKWNECPRCGERAYEILKTHGHCVECLYSDVLDGEGLPFSKKYFKYDDEEESSSTD